MTTAILSTALLGLLIFTLGIAVSLTRGSTKRVIGHDPSPTDRLHKLVRAHGNSAEYAPMLAVLILALGAMNPAAWVGWVMWAVVAFRYLIGPAHRQPREPEPNALHRSARHLRLRHRPLCRNPPLDGIARTP